MATLESSNCPKTKRIGISVLGIGRGHLTQANTMYRILGGRLGMEVPIVLIYCNEREATDYSEYEFSQGPVKVISIKSSSKSPHSSLTVTLHTSYELLCATYYLDEIEDEYKLNGWITFFLHP